MARHAAVPAMDRRSVRLRRTRRRGRIMALGLAVLLAASAAVPLAVLRPSGAPRYAAFDTATAVSRTSLTEASRSESRATPSSGSWDLGSDIDPDARMTVREANNKTVQALINGRDEASVPAGFDPDHADGDTGNAYGFSQCTWWAYVRRHQLGLPAGSHMGDGADWADTARRLGYWVDDTPRVGDVICFARGQYGSDPFYGHVGIVENVGADGSVTTSECGSVRNGKPFSRTFTAIRRGMMDDPVLRPPIPGHWRRFRFGGCIGKTPGDGRPARLRHGEPRGDGSAVVAVVADEERKEDGLEGKEPRNAG